METDDASSGDGEAEYSAASVVASEQETVADGGWPVAPELFEPALQGSDERGQVVVVERSRLSPLAIAFSILALLLIAALGAGLLWALSRRDTSGEGSADRGAVSVSTPADRSVLPRLIGLDLERARQVLADRGLTVDVRKTPSSRTAGTVLAQSPGVGIRVAGGHSVLLVVAGPASSAVPKLVGLDIAQATVLLRKAGVKLEVRPVESDRPKNFVLRQKPAFGDRLTPATVVTLTISQGRPQVTIPRLLGLAAGEASGSLKAVHLQAEIIKRRSSEPTGTVIGQRPGAGTRVDRGTTVKLEVATHPAQVSAPSEPAKVIMPRLVGLSIAAAQSRLRTLGLHVSIERSASSQPEGTVIAATPVTGSQLRRGMTVTVRVSTGPATIEIPDVTGLTENPARQQLEGAGFQVQTTEQSVTDPSQEGVVVDQTPTAGTQAHRSDTITITVGRAAQADTQGQSGVQ